MDGAQATCADAAGIGAPAAWRAARESGSETWKTGDCSPNSTKTLPRFHHLDSHYRTRAKVGVVQTFRSKPEYWKNGKIDWYKTGELWDGFLFDSQEKITGYGQQKSTARLFEPETILMAIYGSPTVGRMGILTRQASCNQAALGLVADSSLMTQIYLYFTLYFLRDHFNSLAQGAAQQNISKAKVASALAIVPERKILTAFDEIAKPIFGQIRTLQSQIQSLRRTRDLLLPRLLSGQIDVEALPEAVAS